jgi:hypothetical protein
MTDGTRAVILNHSTRCRGPSGARLIADLGTTRDDRCTSMMEVAVKRLARGTTLAAAGALGIAIAIGDISHMSVGADTNTTATPESTMACTAPQGGRGGLGQSARANGTVATINGATFTLTLSDNSTATVMTDANTRYDITATSSVGAIATGDVIMAQGTTSGSTFAATAIADNGADAPPPGGRGGNRPGMPGGNGSGGPGPNGQPPAATSGGATGEANGTPPALPNGCTPPQGQQREQHAPPQGQRPPGANGATDGTHVMGTVQQVNGTTLTVSTRDGQTVTVTTDGSTTVSTRKQGTITDLHVGDQVDARAPVK